MKVQEKGFIWYDRVKGMRRRKKWKITIIDASIVDMYI